MCMCMNLVKQYYISEEKTEPFCNVDVNVYVCEKRKCVKNTSLHVQYFQRFLCIYVFF